MEGSDEEVVMAGLENDSQKPPARLTVDRNSLERYRHILNPSENRALKDASRSLSSQEERTGRVVLPYGEHFSLRSRERDERVDSLQGAIEHYKFDIPYELIPLPEKVRVLSSYL